LLAEDITHRKKEQMHRFLSQKLEALGQMAAGIAHEIRSPPFSISVITGGFCRRLLTL